MLESHEIERVVLCHQAVLFITVLSCLVVLLSAEDSHYPVSVVLLSAAAQEAKLSTYGGQLGREAPS